MPRLNYVLVKKLCSYSLSLLFYDNVHPGDFFDKPGSPQFANALLSNFQQRTLRSRFTLSTIPASKLKCSDKCVRLFMCLNI